MADVMEQNLLQTAVLNRTSFHFQPQRNWLNGSISFFFLLFIFIYIYIYIMLVVNKKEKIMLAKISYIISS